ncbi:unnamed protein product [Acanthoscelides obtectus]|uniref:Uncharacterized protein n=1 Tax=Acanthoscelides obtectus TaxID=200917 RepID=A0A9P0M7A2_ACAOB|nr:unnamed protein product [Acanthoscelides obtectus]CAK1688253.1 hypothetical protein AOBTE_LOCUS36647 [Acanthoscelides obtectus]
MLLLLHTIFIYSGYIYLFDFEIITLVRRHLRPMYIRTFRVIDVIILSDDHLLSGSVHHQDLHQHSDHQLIHCSINIKISAVRLRVIKYRNFKHFDIYSFKQDFIKFPWWQVVNSDNVNQKTAILSDMILTLLDSHAPICEKKVTRPPSPWFTDALRAMKNHRNYLFSKYKRTKNLRDWASYKEMRNFFTSAVRQEKRAYIDFVSRTKKSRDMWKTLDQLNVYNRSKKYRNS